MDRRNWMQMIAAGTAAGTIRGLNSIALGNETTGNKQRDYQISNSSNQAKRDYAVNRDSKGSIPFRFSLNTSTIRGQNLSIEEEINIAAKTGYDGIEPWIQELKQYTQGGKSLKDLGKKIKDAGLVVPDAIGFPEWIVDDATKRKQGFEEAKRNMEMVHTIGGTHLAAPPVGATNQKGIDLMAIADRYGELVQLGEKYGVIPIVEVWGFSQTLHRLGETILVAMESHQKKACVLPDIYHLYKGGSGFSSIKLLQQIAIGIFHMNDYPNISADKITDADRVYPGDGIAPLNSVLQALDKMNYKGFLSLELFNRTYWKQDATLVAETGLKKMRAVVSEALTEKSKKS